MPQSLWTLARINSHRLARFWLPWWYFPWWSSIRTGLQAKTQFILWLITWNMLYPKVHMSKVRHQLQCFSCLQWLIQHKIKHKGVTLQIFIIEECDQGAWGGLFACTFSSSILWVESAEVYCISLWHLWLQLLPPVGHLLVEPAPPQSPPSHFQ
jgi:hypothetical protein